MRYFVPFVLCFLCAVSAQASGMAREVLAEINRARTAPAAYATIVQNTATSASPAAVREAVRFLKRARPLAPLRWSPEMSAGALSHVLYQGPRGETGHRGADRSLPWDRISEFGEWKGSVAENIHYGSASPRAIVVALIVDSGVAGRGHRKNIFMPSFSVAGIAHGRHSRFGAMCVIDFAAGFVASDGLHASRTERISDRDL